MHQQERIEHLLKLRCAIIEALGWGDKHSSLTAQQEAVVAHYVLAYKSDEHIAATEALGPV